MSYTRIDRISEEVRREVDAIIRRISLCAKEEKIEEALKRIQEMFC